jgi:hypothetical protein
LLPAPLLQIINGLGISSKRLDPRKARILSRFLAALIASAVAFHLFNSKSKSAPSLSRTNSEDVSSPTLSSKERSKIPSNIPKLPLGIETAPLNINRAVPLAGRTLDLTIYALIRAIDTSMQFLPSPTSPTLQTLASISSPSLFILSSAVIMHSYFYAPLALPRAYVHWITRLAAVDPRLVHALRQVRFGNFIYGKDTGIAPLLGGMAKDLGLPEEYGDPVKTIPVPCELVHHGTGKSCEYHAVIRLTRTLKAALGVYAPLQAFILLRKLTAKNAPRDAQGRLKLTGTAAVDTLRSASFLASFVSLFYYGVCLARTRVGPKAFPAVTPQMWDGGLCVLAGCMACGWSVLIERPKRQTELMLFVVPRAAGVLVPRRYPRTVSFFSLSNRKRANEGDRNFGRSILYSQSALPSF